MKLLDGAKNTLSQTHKKGFSIEVRFLFTLITLILTLVLAFTVVFAALGSFDINRSQTAALLDRELGSLSEQIKTEYATIASHSINLSENLTDELERLLAKEGIKPSEIADNSEKLNELLASVYPTMAAEIKALKSSGVFFILDATVNPSLEGAEYSKAGLFLKNIAAQNNTYTSRYDLRYLYGSLNVGRDHGLTFLPQWKLEYNVSGMDLYNTPMAAAKEHPEASLSQLYYWTAKESDGGSDYGMYCSVPLIASDGTVMGVCGFEISVMQFKLAYAPVIAGQDYAFCMLAPCDENNIYFENAMFAGNYAVTGEQPKCTAAKPSGSGFLTYSCKDAGIFLGSHRTVPLYPNSSCYAGSQFAAVLLTPQSQISEINRASNLKYIGIVLILLLIGVVTSVILCRRNIKPIRNALSSLRREKDRPPEKTRIPEIDDLFEFLDEKDRQNEEERRRIEHEKEEAIAHGEKVKAALYEQEESAVLPDQYELFCENLSTLTDKERIVFDLYLKGYKAKEIAEIMGIAFNTVKFHNKNIYGKLGVSSRSELLRYAKHMNRGKTE